MRRNSGRNCVNQFECKPECGKCCKAPKNGELAVIVLLASDVERLSKHLNMSLEDFICTYCKTTNGVLHMEIKDACPFLRGTQCGVHGAHPTQCRTFPFWRGNMNQETWGALKTLCPGIGEGKPLTLFQINHKIEDSDKLGPIKFVCDP